MKSGRNEIEVQVNGRKAGTTNFDQVDALTECYYWRNATSGAAINS